MYSRILKPLFDRILASFLLILSLPVLFFIIIILFIVNEKEVFFFQIRPGMGEKPFKLIKFKTMRDIYDKNGLLLPDEMRITKVGKIIRKYSLDELLQVINVLNGDMSFVGPRPLLMEYLPLYNATQRARHNVKPGITGLAQVKGRNKLTWEEKFDYDIQYVQNISFMLDFKILFLTIIKVIKSEGINSENSVTMEKFQGVS